MGKLRSSLRTPGVLAAGSVKSQDSGDENDDNETAVRLALGRRTVVMLVFYCSLIGSSS